MCLIVCAYVGKVSCVCVYGFVRMWVRVREYVGKGSCVCV